MRDEWFIRGEVPMTKAEVRAVSLSKLELKQDSVLYDIGAGTGSVSVEASRLMRHGQVWAVEKKPEAAALIRDNIRQFHAENIQVVEGTAPEALGELPRPTHAFIGGSSGNMAEIVDALFCRNPGIRMVINIIALETLAETLALLKERSIDAEILSIQVSKARTAGNYHLMQGQNPVYVISFGGEDRV